MDESIYLSFEYISNCCGTKVIAPDICAGCLEHCEPILDEDEVCPGCGSPIDGGHCIVCKMD